MQGVTTVRKLSLVFCYCIVIDQSLIGLTFSSPNWPTEPKGVVERLGPKHPNHPASSFYYPERESLPPIAAFHFLKVRVPPIRISFITLRLFYWGILIGSGEGVRPKRGFPSWSRAEQRCGCCGEQFKKCFSPFIFVKGGEPRPPFLRPLSPQEPER